ncbi:2Fe-2S iron-sulfur cluster-binding protein [Streptomyces sp. NPDC006544]|uniref:2Fe-2S iron-sulfur cluster-binding protein n=1 Tax=Streptomyces sp. NPDC006544 TaxID=3154583 RepID=UPI0033A9C897
MSENENTGPAGPAWGWEPVPHGGEYDSEATAFVKLPQDMLDALGTGEPLAAPGHGYVPPPMIVPLGTVSTDPAATGTWSIPVQWPEAGTADTGATAGGGSQAGARAPIPASVPMPASVAAAFAEPYGEPYPAEPYAEQLTESYAEPAADGDGRAGESGETAEWRFPEAAASDVWVSGGTGDTGSFGQLAASADWSRAPATLPGGAAAPWASHPDFEAGRDRAAQQAGPATGRDAGPGSGTDFGTDSGPGSGTDFGTDSGPGFEAGPGSASGVLPDAPGSGTGAAGSFGGAFGTMPGRGPRVLGGPGVGTPLPGEYAEPEGEPAYPAPQDIEAAHGPARTPTTGERPHPGATEPEQAHAEAEEPERAREPERDREPERALEPDAGRTAPGDGVRTSGGAGDVPVPGEGTADSAVAAASAEPGEGIPAGEAAYGEVSADQPGGRGATADDAAADADADAGAVAHHEHPPASYVLRVNGADRPVTGAWIGESLLYVLRERLGLAGAKDGCSQGECGACAVQVDGRLVASCLVPAATAAGSEVRTVEGLATDGELSDVQQALCRSGAVQCGFCVPGMAMTIHDLLEGNHAPSELETRQALCGNLCRCSGYAGVIDAVREVSAEREAASEAAAAASAEARIPHQAPPGEGGVHGPHGGQGTLGGHGFQDGGHSSYGGQGDSPGRQGTDGNDQGDTA